MLVHENISDMRSWAPLGPLFLKFDAGTVGPARQAFRQGRNGLGLEIFARGALGPARGRQCRKRAHLPIVMYA